MRDKRASEFESSFLELLSFASSDLTSRSRNLQASSGRSPGADVAAGEPQSRRRCGSGRAPVPVQMRQRASPSPGAEVAAKGSRAKCNVQQCGVRDATPELTGVLDGIGCRGFVGDAGHRKVRASVDRHASCARRACERTPLGEGCDNLGECRTIIICAVVGLVRKVLAAWTPSKRRCRASTDMCGVFPAEGTHGVLMGY